MSLGFYPVFNPPVPEAKFDGLGEVLASHFEVLDQLAEQHGLTRFTAYADTREVPEGFDGPPEDLAEALGPWEDWFSCEEGKTAFERLAELIDQNPDAARRLTSAKEIVEELRALGQSLAVAGPKGAKFRLEWS